VSCADNLLLVQEMLQAASFYIRSCDQAVENEDDLLARMACDQIPPLRLHCDYLNNDLGRLEKRLKAVGRRAKGTHRERCASSSMQTRRTRYEFLAQAFPASRFEKRAACSVVGEAALRWELVLKSQLTTQPYGPTPCNSVLFKTLLVSLKYVQEGTVLDQRRSYARVS
jgi:hypothetical protein